MANKTLFQSAAGPLAPPANAINEAGGKAYEFTPQHALAQYAATGCLNATFYAGAEEQLAKVLELCAQVEPEFIAKTAVFARERGYMKDMPALLCAVLAVRDRELLTAVFPRVIDNAKMLRNFVQIIRSGQVGRKSLGTAPKRLILQWLEARSPEKLFRDSVGQSPSLADIVKMVHPKPQDKEREAFYGYLIGREHDAAALPEKVKQYEAFKRGESLKVPDVPFQMLTALPLTTKDWTEIARNAPWQMTRMNLNTFQRHGVFQDKALADLIARRLSDESAVKRARVFPYQLLAAFKNASGEIPAQVREALQDAMELATNNVPAVPGKVYVLPDVSGSMRSPVTGYRKGANSSVRCIDVAALVSATVLRRNPLAEVIPFEERVVKVAINPRDSVMTNAQKLAALGGGGTSCSAPLAALNARGAQGDLVIYVSDNESWVDVSSRHGTATMKEWNKFRSRNPRARLVCIDVQPYTHTQAAEREDILNVGGFSDQVFDVIAQFTSGLGATWVDHIEEVIL